MRTPLRIQAWLSHRGLVAVLCLLVAAAALSALGAPRKPERRAADVSGAADAPGEIPDGKADSASFDPATYARLNFKIFRDTDGLPQNSAQSVAADLDGHIWVGTQDGAAWHGGSGWTVVDMPSADISNSVRVIMPTDDGEIWFGTDGAVNVLDKGVWTVHTPANGIPQGWSRALLETTDETGRRSIWLGNDGGLARFDGKQWSVLGLGVGLANVSIRGLLSEPTDDGHLVVWIGTEGKGLWKYDSRVGQDPIRVASFPAASAYALARLQWNSPAKRLVVGAEDGLYELRDGAWRRIETVAGRTFDVRCLQETKSASGEFALWAGTYDNGLLANERGAWSVYDTSRGMPHNRIDCLFAAGGVDPTTTLWVGTDAGGLVRTEFGRWRTLDGPPDAKSPVVLGVRTITTASGAEELWVATYGDGILCYTNGEWITSGPRAAPATSGAWAILETRSDAGNPELWFGTDGNGIFRYSDGTWSRFDKSNGFPHPIVYCLYETRSADGKRVIWAGTGGAGIAKYEDDRWTTIGVADGLPNPLVETILETTDADGKPTLWVGTAGGGLARLRNGVWSVFNTQSGLLNDSVYCLRSYRDESNRNLVLVGTAGSGVIVFDPSETIPNFQLFADTSTRPALANNTAYDIQEDAARRIYVLTNRGVTRFAPVEGASGREFTSYTFTTEDGLPGNECNINSATIDNRGRLWVGTINGLALFDPSVEVARRSPPTLRIERAIVEDRVLDGPSLGELSHDETHLTFEYSLLTYFREADTRFQTRLIGLEKGPSDWTRDAKRQFTSLPPGEYTFQVWARDFSGAVVGPVERRFTVLPAIWRTWWAYSLYLFFVGALVFGAVRFRLHSLHRRNLELEEKIRERTAEIEASEKRAREANLAKSVFLANMSHELRTPLNAILGFVQLLDREPDLNARHRGTLEIISRSGSHLLSLINDVLSLSKIEAGRITLQEAPFDLLHMLKGLEEMFGARAASKALACVFEIAEDVPKIVLGDEAKVRQILINLIGNAFKFTDAGTVAVRVGWADPVATFEVTDTGQGISEAEQALLFEPFVQTRSGQRSREGTGLGLVISRSFVRLMGGDIEVESTQGVGSTFRFSANLPVAEKVEPQAVRRRVTHLAPDEPRYRILVVDDKWENRELLSKLLQMVGFDVQEAENGQEAIVQWQNWKPHLIWMDMRMPVLDGYEATRAIRAQEAQTNAQQRSDVQAAQCKIIALTASAFEQDRQAILENGCDDYIPKPFEADAIFACIEQHLGAHFLYEDPAPPTDETEEPETPTAERLAAIPPELLQQLRTAIDLGDIGASQMVIGKIEAHDTHLATALNAYLKAYEFDRLADLIGESA